MSRGPRKSKEVKEAEAPLEFKPIELSPKEMEFLEFMKDYQSKAILSCQVPEAYLSPLYGYSKKQS